MITRTDIDAAATRIAAYVRRTPVLRSDALDAWVGAPTFVKAEHLQRMGAFKYRGATNAVQALSSEDAAHGVCAHSSGNHAAALALAAATRGIPAFVVMPEGTAAAKMAAVERYGGQIKWCANSLAARVETLAAVQAETAAVEVHPFNNAQVMAGAGTAALELQSEVADLDVIVTPIGGGGLCSGTCIAVAPMRVVGGRPVDRATSAADGLRTGTSEITGAILQAHAVEEVVVDETAIADAQSAVWRTLTQLIEPSAAVAFAAARASNLAGRRVGIISTGANVDLAHP